MPFLFVVIVDDYGVVEQLAAQVPDGVAHTLADISKQDLSGLPATDVAYRFGLPAIAAVVSRHPLNEVPRRPRPLNEAQQG